MSLRSISRIPDLPPRPEESHKGTYGKVLVVAGSRGMSGAACLAGLGALRGGAGLVYVAVPEGILPIVAAAEASYLTIPLPEDQQGRIALAAQAELVKQIAGKSVLAAGPGLGRSADLTELVRWLYTAAEVPVVLDADGINALSDPTQTAAARTLPERVVNSGTGDLGGGPFARILTPHPGEFARLIGKSAKDVQGAREEAAAYFAAENNVILVLKGHRTLVTDGERLAVNSTGNSGMATGGTGDVLTGLIAALVSQGMEPFEAAHLGVHLHGLAGDLAAAELSKPGLIASDLPKYLPRAWKSLE